MSRTMIATSSMPSADRSGEMLGGVLRGLADRSVDRLAESLEPGIERCVAGFDEAVGVEHDSVARPDRRSAGGVPGVGIQPEWPTWR